jgi:hypothetical protein
MKVRKEINMLKVHFLDRCSYCGGKAYLPVGETINTKGESYTRYTPCQMCKGTGEHGKWVDLIDFLEMLKQTQCKHEDPSYRGEMHFRAGDVWDDVEEVCDDCGAKLNHQTLRDFIQD